MSANSNKLLLYLNSNRSLLILFITPIIVSLYSSSNYTCTKDKKTSCKEIQTSLRSGQKNNKYDSCKYDCVYKKKKKDFANE